ncbi:MAG TPA: hypothetical protein VMN36_07145 [Verrucomicrobiales bacterium]|nr:hypothetical protein [Verrucomicrobiales bacterium]
MPVVYSDLKPPWPITGLMLLLGSLTAAAGSGSSWADLRAWTSEGPDGPETVQAAFVDIDRTRVSIAVEGESTARALPISRLAPEDRAALTQFWKDQLAPFWVLDPPAGLPEQGISVNPQVRVVREDRDRRLFVYETQHFRFEADDQLSTSLVHDCSRAFEITYELFIRLPLGLRPSPPEGGRYRVRLFRDRKDYVAIGKAPPNTAGVYTFDDRTNKVPFDSLGLVREGDKWRMDPKHYDTHTLIHETTHQLMHDWGQIIPLWVAEGLAEAVACIPYRTGILLVGDWRKGVSAHLDSSLFNAVSAAALEVMEEIALAPSPQRHPLFSQMEQMRALWEGQPPPAAELSRTFGITLADPAELLIMSHQRFMSQGLDTPPFARNTTRFQPIQQIPASFHYLTSLVIAYHLLTQDGTQGPRRFRAYLMRLQLLYQESVQWQETPDAKILTDAPEVIKKLRAIDLEREHPYSRLALPVLLRNQSMDAFRTRVSGSSGLPLGRRAARE